MLEKIKRFWICKMKKQHFFIQNHNEIEGKSTVKIYYKCKFCGKEACQTLNCTFDPVKKKGKILNEKES